MRSSSKSNIIWPVILIIACPFVWADPKTTSRRKLSSTIAPQGPALAQVQKNSTDPLASSWPRSVYLGYRSQYLGPSVGHFSSSDQIRPVSGEINPYNHQRWINDLSAGYHPFGESGFYAGGFGRVNVLPFEFGNGSGFEGGDVGPIIGNSRLIATREVSLATEFRVLAPTGTLSRANHVSLSFESVQFLHYRPAGTRFSLGLFNMMSRHFFDNDSENPSPAIDGTKFFEVRSSPFAGYRLSPWISAQVRWDLYYFYYYNVRELTRQWNLNPTAIAPGMLFNLNRSVQIMPYMSIYPINPTLDSTSLGLQLFAIFG